jgi:hypothetical protein
VPLTVEALLGHLGALEGELPRFRQQLKKKYYDH